MYYQLFYYSKKGEAFARSFQATLSFYQSPSLQSICMGSIIREYGRVTISLGYRVRQAVG